MKHNARQAARLEKKRARQQQQRPKPGKSYDKAAYDGTTTAEEES